jgi:two-component system, OmpR family, response regulator
MRILIAEDEQTVAASVAAALKAQGFVPHCVHDGEEAWFQGSTENFAAIVLDLGLPTMDGLSVLQRWRAEGITTPVIILSARGTWAERVDGIDTGADDYLPKPFEMDELLARVRAVLRRTNGQATSDVSAGGLHMDLKTAEATYNGEPCHLTAMEFRLLHHLALHSGMHVAKEELAEALYAVNHDREANAIEAIISRIRKKIAADIIENKRGFGYRLKSPDSAGVQ